MNIILSLMIIMFSDLEMTIEALKRTIAETSASLKNSQQMLTQKNTELELVVNELKSSQDKVSKSIEHTIYCSYGLFINHYLCY